MHAHLDVQAGIVLKDGARPSPRRQCRLLDTCLFRAFRAVLTLGPDIAEAYLVVRVGDVMVDQLHTLDVSPSLGDL